MFSTLWHWCDDNHDDDLHHDQCSWMSITVSERDSHLIDVFQVAIKPQHPHVGPNGMVYLPYAISVTFYSIEPTFCVISFEVVGLICNLHTSNSYLHSWNESSNLVACLDALLAVFMQRPFVYLHFSLSF